MPVPLTQKTVRGADRKYIYDGGEIPYLLSPQSMNSILFQVIHNGYANHKFYIYFISIYALYLLRKASPSDLSIHEKPETQFL